MARPRDERQLQTAQQAWIAGDHARAAAICDELVRRNPRNFKARGIIGQFAKIQGDLDAAASHIQKCIDLRPRDTAPHILLGEIDTVE